MRRYGSGSVFPEKVSGKATGRAIAQWELPKVNGKRRRRQVIAATEAEAWKAMRKAQAAEGRSSSPSRESTESVRAFLAKWMRDVVAKQRRERTYVGYRSILANVPDTILDLDLRDGPPLAHAINAWLLSLDRHPRTVAHYAACLRAAFGYAVRKGMMDRNPAADLDLPPIPRTERIPLTGDELREFLAGVEGPLSPLWITAAWTGLRSGELLGLRWEDVSLERASLVVRHSLTRLPRKPTRDNPLKTGYHITEPKTGRSRRTVPLLPFVVDALRPLRKAYLAQTPELDQNLVFATAAGSPLDARWVYRQFQRALVETGTRPVRLHDLRHGAATLMIQSGTDLATVSAILGHSNIGTTVDLYGHLTDSHKRTAMERMATA